MEDFSAVFYNEAIDLLADIEDELMDLEADPENADLINGIFRAMHTIKGSAGMFGFDEISKFTHEVETALDKVRNGQLKVSKELIDIVLESKDLIQLMLNKEEIDSNVKKEILERLDKISGNSKKIIEDETKSVNAPAKELITIEYTYRIKFIPNEDIFLSGNNPLHYLQDLSQIGYADIFAMCEHIPNISEINSSSCYISWEIILTTEKTIDDIKDIFIFVEDLCQLKIDLINETHDNEPIEVKRIGEILLDRGGVKKEDLDRALSKQTNIGNILVTDGATSEEQLEAALLEQKHLRRVQENKQKDANVNTIKVESEKLDLLVDLVGELVTAQANLFEISKQREDDDDLFAVTEAIERLSANLRDNAMSLRMVPIGTIFNKYKRLVRDLSKQLDKKVNFVTKGGETELDKNVIDKLGDPLVHIIRNSMDHGIETYEERLKVDKEMEATVILSAEQVGSDIIVQINDDGKGIDPKVIFKKAVEKKIIAEDANLTTGQCLNLIFEPGFSTAKNISSVSGRGVGMDVVRKNIESLRGNVAVSSEFGIGTSITMRIPLTLAIIEGLLTSIDSQCFILPLDPIVECIELSEKDIEEMNGKAMVKVRGELIPYVSLREEFGIDTSIPKIQQIVVMVSGKKRIGFAVDKVLGNHQTVIKPLGEAFKDVDFVTGATILGDGSIGLILDTIRLVHSIF